MVSKALPHFRAGGNEGNSESLEKHTSMHHSALALLFTLIATATSAADYTRIPAGQFTSVIANDAAPGSTRVDAFSLRTKPVTNGEFFAFVKQHPQWQRGKAASVFVDARYLAHWQSATRMGEFVSPDQPLTNVSWFAASAFCEAEQARLPTWLEWEFVAAADELRADARVSATWQSRILNWYAQPASALPRKVGGTPNFYGVRDVHGLIWEWVEDFNALLVSADSRNQGDADKQAFCGAGGINLQDPSNYAVMMRIALLSSLTAKDTTSSLGFRCARSIVHKEQK